MIEVYLRRDGDAYALLRDALARHGIPALPWMERGEHGKPYFPDLPHLHFNLSHTQGFCLCAISDGPVGVDIEVVRPRRPSLPRYCLTDEEYARFLAAGGGWEEFYRLWTLKEAWCKYVGRGLGQPKLWSLPPPIPHQSHGGQGFQAALCARELPKVWREI